MQTRSVDYLPLYLKETVSPESFVIPSHSRGCLDLGQGLSLLESSLLLESQDLESVEVGKRLSSFGLVLSLGPLALLPLGVDLCLLPCRL